MRTSAPSFPPNRCWCGMKSMCSRICKIAPFFSVWLLLNVSLSGQSNADWQVGLGSWNASSNWNCGWAFPNGCVPNGGTVVSIINGGIATLNTSAAASGLWIQNGGLVADTGGNLTISSTGNSTNAIEVGYGGNGTLTVQNGAVLTNLSLYGADIGCCSGGAGTVNISGAGSNWSNSGYVNVGGAGNGTLALNSGAVGSSGYLAVGEVAFGSMTLADPGSKWTNTGNLEVGQLVGSVGQVAVGSGATLTNSGGLYLGELLLGDEARAPLDSRYRCRSTRTAFEKRAIAHRRLRWLVPSLLRPQPLRPLAGRAHAGAPVGCRVGIPCPRVAALRSEGRRHGVGHRHASPSRRREGSATLAPRQRRQVAVLFYRLEHTARAAPEMDPEDFEALEMRLHSALDEAFGDLARGSTHFAQGGRFVFFGYPVAYGQDARRAVEAALRLVALARGLNEALAREGAGGLEVRVGIHSGVVLSGSGVSEIRGAALGIATDLEHCAARGQILVSPAAWQMLEGHFRGETLQDGNFAVLGAMEDTESGIAAGVMVGRDLELNMLLSRLEEARAGETQMALISGEAGIGKSRLLQALRDSPGAAGVAWAECGCSPYFQASAFHPLIELVHTLTRGPARAGKRATSRARSCNSSRAAGMNPRRKDSARHCAASAPSQP